MRAKRLWSDLTLALGAGFIGYELGRLTKSNLFYSQAFQISFGVIFGIIIMALVIGGIAVEISERRKLGALKKRISIVSEDGRTSIIVEPKT